MIDPLPISAELSKYELLEEIGHGGMATVYRARDRRLGREVALKLLHRHLRESEEIESRFSSEARAVAKLRHQNIVAVFDVSDETEPERYLVMELVRGLTLRQLLKQQGALPVELAAAVVLEIASGLEHAHCEGVVHRDVKPENVLLDLSSSEPRSGDDAEPARVKLTDFGIAKLLDAQGVTSTGQVLGSPAHMAPEQIEGRQVDGRADIFSLGVLFYECVVGRLPFDGRNPAQVLRNVLEGNFEPPERLKPEVGSRWSRLIVKALQREPEARHSTIAEFASAVRVELETLGWGSVRHEIARFLQDAATYRGQFAERIVADLTRAGSTARQARNWPLAADQLGRALAYKPGDPTLLRLVSGLKTRQRVKLGTAMLSLLLLAASAVAAWVYSLGDQVSGDATVEAAGSQRPLTTGTQSAAVLGSNRPTEPGSPDPQKAAKRPSRSERGGTAERGGVRPAPKRSAEPEVEPVPETRAVSVRITGAAGGTLKIDGKELPWFGGVQHTLTIGEHSFEFIPPNDSCCVATRKTVLVVPGTGEQVVIGKIPFKDATLSLQGAADGSAVSCPTLFADKVVLPGQRSVSMSQAQAKGTCVFTGAAGASTVQKTVTLTAGQTTVLSWP